MTKESKVEKKIVEYVKNSGWSVIMVEATDYMPSFAYTIGLWKSYDHPELIIFGLTVKALHLVVNDLGEAIKKGKSFNPHISYADVFDNSDIHIIPVDEGNIKDYFGYALWFHHTSAFPALQIVWQDRGNKFPWDESYQDEFKYRQPLLDRNASFKFREEKNIAVFTTRQWIDNGQPILHVVHDEEGDWQFLTGDQLPQDVRIVCLEQMIAQDKTLNDLFNLDYGEQARRDSTNHKWQRSKSDIED
jgi:hypothetical protein